MTTPHLSARILSPRLVGRVWGGDRLRPLAPNGAPTGPIGEAWYGEADERAGGVLVKLLDVQERLSVQVHPDDDLARKIHGADAIGKHEAWVVLEAADGAELLLGRAPLVTADALAAALASGADVTPLLAHHAVQRGDVFDVPTGALHALMPGLFIWEVQQRSDRTYRVADWGRDDPARPLHRAEAQRAADPVHLTQRTAAIRWGEAGEQLLVASPHFEIRALVGAWRGVLRVGELGATVTSTAAATVGPLSLTTLATAHLEPGSHQVELPPGGALLVAEAR